MESEFVKALATWYVNEEVEQRQDNMLNGHLEAAQVQYIIHAPDKKRC